jgi:acyl carrier protein
MKRTQFCITCITLGVALTGCDKPRPRQDSQNGQNEAVGAQRDTVVAARVRKEIGGILGKSPNTIKATDQFVRDLGADSLDTVEIVMAVEDAFSISIADEDAVKLITVGDLINYVTRSR